VRASRLAWSNWRRSRTQCACQNRLSIVFFVVQGYRTTLGKKWKIVRVRRGTRSQYTITSLTSHQTQGETEFVSVTVRVAELSVEALRFGC